nr:MAG TPA: hypothetical protein [Caudoviricetes sp.]DAY74497.1 MAG TPA: hypothetical protein [Caudoviricetes sp.]
MNSMNTHSLFFHGSNDNRLNYLLLSRLYFY